MDVSGLVLRGGESVTASGRVVILGDGAWFEPPLPVHPILISGGPPVARPGHFAVPVVGVDPARLAHRRERDGVVEGWAQLTGDWRPDGRMSVTAQRQPVAPAEGWRRTPEWRIPPCPGPPGGWPPGPLPPGADATGVEELIVNRTVFHPDPDTEVLVVAAEQPERVAAALRPGYGHRLCVVPSRWSWRRLDEVAARLRTGMRDWLIYASGTSSAPDGQAIVTATMTRVLPDLADWAAGLPDGLLVAEPWLAPAPA